RHDGSRQQPRVRGRQVTAHQSLLRLDVRGPLPGHAQAHGIRRRHHHGPRGTVQALVAAEGTDADAIAIGPAGERRVRFAAMAHYWRNREGVSGRGGLGAVLGSKNLKAVVVKGGRKTEVADAPGLKALIDQTREPLKTGTQALSTFGTPFLVGPINAIGAL